MKKLTYLIALCVGLALPAFALVSTTETATFTRDGGNTVAVPRPSGNCNSLPLANVNATAAFTVPTTASSNANNGNGYAKIWAKGGNYAAIASSATANRNASPAPWNPAATITDGSAPDPNPQFYQLDPIGASRITSLTVVGDPSATYPMGVTVCFYKGKGN